MARNSGSGGSRVVFPSLDERHQIRAATTPARREQIDPERGRHAPCGNHDTREGRTKRAADIQADAVERDGRLQKGPRYELRNDGLPCRHDQRSGARGEKAEHDQSAG